MNAFVGIDNGVTGSVGIVWEDGKAAFIRMSELTDSEQDYVKAKRNITRVKARRLYRWLKDKIEDTDRVFVMIERPMVNPTRFRSTISAVRCLENVLIVVQDMLGFAFEYVDSRKWQKELLPFGCTGADELKKASMDIGIRKFPALKAEIAKQKDADGLLIAWFCRKENGNG